MHNICCYIEATTLKQFSESFKIRCDGFCFHIDDQNWPINTREIWQFLLKRLFQCVHGIIYYQINYIDLR